MSYKTENHMAKKRKKKNTLTICVVKNLSQKTETKTKKVKQNKKTEKTKHAEMNKFN